MQKLKSLGVQMAGCYKGGTGVLMDRRNGHAIELADSRGLGYFDTNLFPKLRKMPEYSKMPKSCALNEDYTVMDEAKFRPRSHHRKGPEHMQLLSCWHCVYVGEYGGGGSLGGESYI